MCRPNHNIGDDNVSLILGDNMIYGSRLERLLKAASNLKEGHGI